MSTEIKSLKVGVALGSSKNAMFQYRDIKFTPTQLITQLTIWLGDADNLEDIEVLSISKTSLASLVVVPDNALALPQVAQEVIVMRLNDFLKQYVSAETLLDWELNHEYL